MDIFTNAKTVAAQPTKSKKGAAPVIACDSLENLAALEAVKANVEAAIVIEKLTVNSIAFDHFVTEGMKISRKPVNAKGVDNGTEGSLQLRARSSRSPLTEDEQKLLSEYKIPFDEAVAKEETFIINPEYVNNNELMAKVAEALAAVNLPLDFILKQNKESTFVATEESIDAVFARTNPQEVRALLPLVTTQATRVSLCEGVDPFAVVERVMAAHAAAENADGAE